MKPDAGKPFLVRLTRAFGYALEGVGRASRDRMFRCQLVCGVAACAVAAWLKVSMAELAVLVLVITLVLSLEVLNSAIEFTVDLVSPEPHPLAKLAKDAAAGAVLLASLGAVAVGAIVFVPRLLRLLES